MKLLDLCVLEIISFVSGSDQVPEAPVRNVQHEVMHHVAEASLILFHIYP